jgi:hypothetical protein
VKDWQRLARLLLDALGDHVEGRGRPTWVMVLEDPENPSGEHFALALLDQPEALLESVVPPECLAVGAVATGTVHAANGPRESRLGFSPGTTSGVRMCCLVSRQGDMGWAMLTPDGRTIEEAPTTGRLVEDLRSCFG